MAPQLIAPAALPSTVVDRILASQNKDSSAVNVFDALERALTVCLRIRKNNKDGSRRLLAICSRGVGYNLSDDEIVQLVRKVEAEKPFPKSYSPPEIIKRIRDAEKRVERGSELVTKPIINVTSVDLDYVTERIWHVIKEKNNPPFLFRFAGLPSRIETNDHGEPQIRQGTFDVMRNEIARLFHFLKRKADGMEYPCPPPEAVVSNLLASPNIPLPILTRVVSAPVFGPDGTLLTQPGYHAGAQTFYKPVAGFELPEVPKSPSPTEIKNARDLLTQEFLGDFPFAGQSELAHAVALPLLFFARGMIEGPTPFHLIDKTAPGTGGTLLLASSHSLATGREASFMTEGRNNEEMRKRLTSTLRNGPESIMLDNIRERLDSAAFASAITAPYWEDRILGASQVVRLPIQTIWAGTGNNVGMSNEISRRTVRIRLDAQVERPWLRTGFRHEDLRGWIKAERARLVHACLTLIQAWIAASKPAGTKSLGMFESWSKTMGGILAVAGIDGFLGNLEDFYADSDDETAALRAFLLSWLRAHNTQGVTSADLYSLATGDNGLDLGKGDERSQKIRLGKLIATNCNRVYQLWSDYWNLTVRLMAGGTFRRAGLWRLEPHNLPLSPAEPV